MTSSTNSQTEASGSGQLNVGGSIHDPTDPIGRLLFTVLSMIAEADPARARTPEGPAVANAKGRLGGKPPKLKPTQEAHLVKLWRGGENTRLELTGRAVLREPRRCTARSNAEALPSPARPPELKL